MSQPGQISFARFPQRLSVAIPFMSFSESDASGDGMGLLRRPLRRTPPRHRPHGQGESVPALNQISRRPIRSQLKPLPSMKPNLIATTAAPLLLLIAWLLIPQTAHCFYNPSTGRWLSRDPIEEGGSKNLYCFAENRPVIAFD